MSVNKRSRTVSLFLSAVSKSEGVRGRYENSASSLGTDTSAKRAILARAALIPGDTSTIKNIKYFPRQRWKTQRYIFSSQTDIGCLHITKNRILNARSALEVRSTHLSAVEALAVPVVDSVSMATGIQIIMLCRMKLIKNA